MVAWLSWGYFLFDIYENFFQQNIDLMQLLNAFPDGVIAFFGGDIDIFAPEGFLHLEFFSYIPIILGIMVISSAANMITRKEEEGTLDIIIAQPISRSEVLWSEFLALSFRLTLILVRTWAGFALGLAQTSSFDLTQGQLFQPFVSLYAVLLVFMSLSLLLSMVLTSSNAASVVTGFLLIASYFIYSLAGINENLKVANRFSPLKYYQGGAAVNGLDVQKLLILFGITLIFTVLAWFLFVKRDLRFSSSGGLRFVFPRKGE